MYPDRDILSNVPRLGYITVRDQNMQEMGLTEGGKILPALFFVNEYNNTNKKLQTKKKRFFKSSQKRQQLVEEKGSDNIR